MLVAIEEIEGVKHTIVWHFDTCNTKKNSCEKWKKFQHTWELFLEDCYGLLHIATALPPFPSKPTADDAKLLHLYAAHGLMVWWTDNDEEKPMNCAWLVNRDMLHYNSMVEATDLIKRITITHALDEQGNRIEIALKD
jgi:hypothetical protein